MRFLLTQIGIGRLVGTSKGIWLGKRECFRVVKNLKHTIGSQNLDLMAKGSKAGFYAVRKGNEPGIYATWPECEAQVKGFRGAVHQKFPTREEALAFINGEANGALSTKIRLPSIDSMDSNSNAKDHALKRKETIDQPELPIKKPRLPFSTSSTSSKNTTEEVRVVEVYTDGAASSNGKGAAAKAGWGVYFPQYNHLSESGRLDGPEQTNNRAELMAIIRAIQLNPDPNAQLRIFTDSKYCINCLNEWQFKWRKNAWKRGKDEDVKNKDLIRLCEFEIRKCAKRPFILYVKGHSTNQGNEEADRLAVLGAKMAEVPRSEWKDYEPPPSDDDEGYEKAARYWEKAGFSRTASITKSRQK